MKRLLAVIIIVLLLLSPSCSKKNNLLFPAKGNTCIIPPPSDISESIERLNRIKKAVYSDYNNSYDFIMDYIVSSPSKKEGELLYYTKEQAAEFIKEMESAVIVRDYYRKDGIIPDITFHDDTHDVYQSIFIGTEECNSYIFITSYTQKSKYFDGHDFKDNNTVSYSYDINVNGQNMTVCKIKNSSLIHNFAIDYEVYYKTDDRCMVFSFFASENFKLKEVKEALERLSFVKVGDLMKEAEVTTK